MTSPGGVKPPTADQVLAVLRQESTQLKNVSAADAKNIMASPAFKKAVTEGNKDLARAAVVRYFEAVGKIKTAKLIDRDFQALDDGKHADAKAPPPAMPLQPPPATPAPAAPATPAPPLAATSSGTPGTGYTIPRAPTGRHATPGTPSPRSRSRSVITPGSASVSSSPSFASPGSVMSSGSTSSRSSSSVSPPRFSRQYPPPPPPPPVFSPGSTPPRMGSLGGSGTSTPGTTNNAYNTYNSTYNSHGGLSIADTQRAVKNALDESKTVIRDSVDDEPWEQLHPLVETDKLRYGRALLNKSLMRPGREAMPETPYVGNRGLERGDIINQPKLNAAGRLVRPDPTVGDAIVDSKQSMDTATDTLRPQFKEAPGAAVVPSPKEQVLSDIMFDSFSTVLPGWGLGMQNKMFLMEEERDEKIVNAEPMAEPRQDIGPIQGPDRMPPEWQSLMSRSNRKRLHEQDVREQLNASMLEQRLGTGSLNILGDDVGFLRSISDRGLPRDRESCFEPVVVNSMAWQPVKIPAGYQLARIAMRKTYDALRMPAKVVPTMAQSGGATFPMANAWDEMMHLPAMN